MTAGTYCRLSKNDEGKQQFRLDVPSAGCDELITCMALAEQSRKHYVGDRRAQDDFLTRIGLRQLLADAQRGDVIIMPREILRGLVSAGLVLGRRGSRVRIPDLPRVTRRWRLRIEQ